MNAVTQASVVEVREPIFVFGSQEYGHPTGDGSALAARFHGAEPDCWRGLVGNSYAIPYRDRAGQRLGAAALAEQIATFIQFAKQNPDLRFRIARFGCEPGAYTDSDMAPLFKAAPSTCVLPALWRRALGTLTTAQVLIFDPMIRLQNADWLAHLKQYLTVNMPLWGVAKCEFLSIGGARRVSAVAKAAHSFDFKHREIRANPHYYGKEAELASEMLAVWHATHMLSITDVNQTALPSYMRLATHAIKNGLVVDDFTLR